MSFMISYIWKYSLLSAFLASDGISKSIVDSRPSCLALTNDNEISSRLISDAASCRSIAFGSSTRGLGEVGGERSMRNNVHRDILVERNATFEIESGDTIMICAVSSSLASCWWAAVCRRFLLALRCRPARFSLHAASPFRRPAEANHPVEDRADRRNVFASAIRKFVTS